MLDRSWRAAVPLLIVVALIVQTGCRRVQRASAADPEQARRLLTQALDAWKSGETPDAFKTRTSATAVDPEWQNGVRLLAYEVLGDGRMDGFDWQCRVRLSTQDTSGKKAEPKAIYNVSTAPAQVVVRGEQ